MTIGVIEEHFWERLCDLMDMSDLLKNPELRTWKGRNKNRHMIRPRLKEKFLAKDRDTWLKELLKADIPAAPVNEIKDLLNDPQIKHNQLLGIDEKGNFLAQMTKPFPVSALVKDMNESSAPKLGENTETILKKLGYSSEEFHDFKETGII